MHQIDITVCKKPLQLSGLKTIKICFYWWFCVLAFLEVGVLLGSCTSVGPAHVSVVSWGSVWWLFLGHGLLLAEGSQFLSTGSQPPEDGSGLVLMVEARVHEDCRNLQSLWSLILDLEHCQTHCVLLATSGYKASLDEVGGEIHSNLLMGSAVKSHWKDVEVGKLFIGEISTMGTQCLLNCLEPIRHLMNIN